jgi:excisionase family DNA binding protein
MVDAARRQYDTADFAVGSACYILCMKTNERELLHVREAAREVGVHEATIRRAIRSGELPAVTLGEHGRYRVRRADLEAFLVPAGIDKPATTLGRSRIVAARQV